MYSEGNAVDTGKFQYMKQFVTSAREYIATKSENSLNVMNKMLGFISSSDGVVFSPGRVEVSAFFGSLYEVMTLNPSGLHWLAIAVLNRSLKDSAAKQIFVHTFRFFPVLASLLTDGLLPENKMKLLSLMEVLSCGIKINYQESYLVNLLNILSSLAMDSSDADDASRKLSELALSVLANLCYGNSSVVYTLMRTVNTRDLIKHLVSMKGNEGAGVHVCRLLMSLQAVQGAPLAGDVYNFLGVSLRAFTQGIKDCDATILQHSSSFLADLCSDTQTKSYVISYEKFEGPLQEALKMSSLLLATTSQNEHGKDTNQCLRSTLLFLLNLAELELYSIRSCHGIIAELCVKSSHIYDCRGPAFGLLAALVLQYIEDGMLPDDVMAPMSLGFTRLLSPDSLDAKSAGLEWLQLIAALCDCGATQDGVLLNVKSEQFDEIVYRILDNAIMIGTLEETYTLESVLTGCRLCLTLASRNATWDAVLHRMLSNKSVQRVLSYCLGTLKNSKRKETLDIIKHPHFPVDKINQVFCCNHSQLEQTILENRASITNNSTEVSMAASSISPSLSSHQEQMVDKLIQKLELALQNNQMNNVEMSSLIELYSCKMNCLENRLHASSMGLQAATHNVGSLNNALVLLQTSSRTQQDVLYRTQTQNERLKENVTRLSEQLSDAELSICKFQGKLAAERLDREQQITNSRWKHSQKIKELESEIETQTTQVTVLSSQILEMEMANNGLKDRLTEQATKNSELASVLVTFEDRVKKRDKKLEEVNSLHSTLKHDLEQSHQTIKALEKTIMERDKRLTQVTSQLEEMHRVQDIIANLMGNKGVSNNASNNSMNH